MSEHRFAVTVYVEGWPEDDERSECDYAEAALHTASLPDAARLDGFADLRAQADIVSVVEDE